MDVNASVVTTLDPWAHINAYVIKQHAQLPSVLLVYLDKARKGTESCVALFASNRQIVWPHNSYFFLASLRAPHGAVVS